MKQQIFVDPKGLEPLTFSLWANCYYQLSYGSKNPPAVLRVGHSKGQPRCAWTSEAWGALLTWDWEPSVRFELTCSEETGLQIRCNRPLCEEGMARGKCIHNTSWKLSVDDKNKDFHLRPSWRGTGYLYLRRTPSDLLCVKMDSNHRPKSVWCVHTNR